MSIKKLYKSRIPSVRYILKDGRNLSFVGGRFLTDDPEEIAELDAEVARNHIHIYKDAKELEVDTTLEDEINAAMAAAKADVLARRNAVNPQNDMGNSQQGKLMPASTTSIGEAAQNSDSGMVITGVGARLASLKSK